MNNHQKRHRDKGEKENATGVKIINKKSGIVITGIFVAFVAGLIALSVPLITNSPLFASFDNENSEFVMEEIKLNAAHDSRHLVIHDHVQLNVKVQGSDTIVPASIGMAPTFYKDHSLDSFGIQDPPMAPLHTHDSDGLIHIESTQMRDFTLGEFLDIWGMDLAKPSGSNGNEMTAILSVDGIQVSDYRNHILRNGQNLMLEFS